MIKRIELVNFMSHERTVIEPSAGLTVLVGPNNCGKSAFVSALQILCHNAKSSYVLRHGEKKCQIIVETDDGHTIEWAKTKSGSPYYLINGEKHDRLRGNIPPKLHEILGLSKVACEKDQFDIHFGEQKDPVFLLNDSGKAAAQFFASSSDAIRLVEMQDRHKSKVLLSKRENKELESEIEQCGELLEELEPLDELDSRLKECERQFESIQSEEASLAQCEIVIRAIEEIQSQLLVQNEQLEMLSDIVQPPTLEDVDCLQTLVREASKADRQFNKAKAASAALGPLTAPPELGDPLPLNQISIDLQQAERDFEFSQATFNMLRKVAEPPELGNETKLTDFVGQLDQSELAVSRLNAYAGSLQSLQAPPTLEDNLQLRELLDSISKSENSLKAVEKRLASVAVELDETKTEVQEWVSLNPNCPTCGAETNVDGILKHGGHRHG